MRRKERENAIVCVNVRVCVSVCVFMGGCMYVSECVCMCVQALVHGCVYEREKEKE